MFPHDVDPRTVLAAIVQSSEDAIVGKTLDGTIISWNTGAEAVFGYTAAEALGASVTMLLPPERLGEERRILASLARGERVPHFETQRVRKDGTIIDVSLSVSPIKDGTGRVVGGAKIARDVTERKRLEVEQRALLAKEQAARALAESASRAKDVFLATISHELRAPLSPIVTWAKMLRQGTLEEKQRERAVEVIERNATAQAQLIDDLLDVSRIVSGKLRLQVTSVDLCDVVSAACEVVRPAADAKQISLQSLLDSDVGAVAGDPHRLQQVVWNLLSNAIKFTPKGGRVRVMLERVDSHVDIVVSDTGQGFSGEFEPHLFERFQQADTGAARSHGGLGLGLAIVRHIVEMHGGTVTARSDGEGLGATFRVRLPREAVARSEPSERHPTLSGRPVDSHLMRLDDLRVLVVDDDPDSSEAVAMLLATQGAEVRVAGSAAAALDELGLWMPDVMVSDIGMPGEDGYSLLAKVRALPPPVGDLQAIALTAYATTDDRVRSFSAGFQAHMAKPVDSSELVAIVGSFGRRKATARPR
jgi:PAS domain S-box-containing protein